MPNDSNTTVVVIPETREDMLNAKMIADKTNAGDPIVYTPWNFSEEREAMFRERLNSMDENSRLYVCAHGSVRDGQYGFDMNGEQGTPDFLAKSLADGQLENAQRINLVMCESGKIFPSQRASFAQEFHKELAQQNSPIMTNVAAYQTPVGIFQNPNYPELTGRKVIVNEGQSIEEGVWAKDNPAKVVYGWRENSFGENQQIALRSKEGQNTRVQDTMNQLDSARRNRNENQTVEKPEEPNIETPRRRF